MITPIKIKSNYISFKGEAQQLEYIDVKPGYLDFLFHKSSFFRYDDTEYKNIDSFMINTLKSKHNNKPLNILSIGCSYGEEVYSYALGLDDLNPKPIIVGIDVSESAINKAKEGEYQLNKFEQNYLINNSNTYDYCTINTQARKKFKEHFECINGTQEIWKLKKGHLPNCEFKKLGIENLRNEFKPNSQDCILCRLILYHVDSLEICNPAKYKAILQGIYDTLKPGGLLCLSSDEYNDYDKTLLKMGFRHYSKTPYIYQKPHTIKSGIASLLNNISFNKLKFNNIN